MLYFAYGANLSRGAMRASAPSSEPAGRARLAGWRFVIAASGWASIVPDPAAAVEGLLWRVDSADIERLDVFEGVGEGLYGKEIVRVTSGTREIEAWVYVETKGGTGRPRPGYLEAILDAARDLGLAPEYIEALARWR
ncbi:MAG: gamma-glutamylcyclotransferase family protein [Thermoanaerobaculia bacterium]